jgi:hypothetical protein
MVCFYLIRHSHFNLNFCCCMFCNSFVFPKKKHVKVCLLCVLGGYFFDGSIRNPVVLFCSSLQGWDLRIFQFAAVLGWVILGIREVCRTRPPKLSLAFYAVFAVSFIVWLTIGLPFNDLANSSFSVSGEILNELSKTCLFFAFALQIGFKGKTKFKV